MRRSIFVASVLLILMMYASSVAAQEIYVIKPGDSLWKIAQDHGTTVDELRRVNNLSGDFLQAGDRLIISYAANVASKNESLEFDIYTVKAGDTLWYISRQTNTSIARIKELNNLKTDNLYIGQELKVTKSNPTPSRSAVALEASRLVVFAAELLGTPYVYGGTSRSGFDCSGFVQYVYKEHGYNISRTTHTQFNDGIAVSRENLTTGDLVFFNTYGGVSHVGIYTENGNFIHSSSGRSRGVVYSSLNEGYYNTRYVGARRIIR